MDSLDPTARAVDPIQESLSSRMEPSPRPTNWRALMVAGAVAIGAALVVRANLPRKSEGRPSDQVWIEMQTETRSLLSQGALNPAEQLAEASIPLAVRTFGEVHPAVAESLTTMADVLSAGGRSAAADAFYARALEMHIKLNGPRSREAAVADGNFALNLMKQERFAEAKRLFDLAVTIQESVSGPDHADTAVAINNLAIMHDTMDDPASAEPLHERALNIRIKATGPASQTTAASQSNLAACLRRRLEYGQIPEKDQEAVRAKAKRLYRQALAIRERLLGTNHLEVSSSLVGLSSLARLEDDLEAADLFGLQALAIRESKLGQMHVLTLAALDNLGSVRARQGLNEEAVRYFAFVAERRAKALGPTHHQTLESLGKLVSVLVEEKNFMEAEPPLRAWIAGLEKTSLPRPTHLRKAFDQLIVVLEDTDRKDEVAAVREQASKAVSDAEAAVASLIAESRVREQQDREAIKAHLAPAHPPAAGAVVRNVLQAAPPSAPAAVELKSKSRSEDTPK